MEVLLIKKGGAEGRNRTGTDFVRHPLKMVCLPVPPLRHHMNKNPMLIKINMLFKFI